MTRRGLLAWLFFACLISVCFIFALESKSLASTAMSMNANEVAITGDSMVLFLQNTGVRPSNIWIGAYYALPPNPPIGVEADTTGGYAIRGIDNDVNGYGVYGSSSNGTAVYGTSSAGVAVVGSTTTGYAGLFNGDVIVNGTLTKTTDNFAQPHPSDPSKEVVYAVIEGPEHAVFYRGTAKLINGKAVIETPEYFRVVAGNEGITVNFTPRSEESMGLAAVSVKKERVEVRELMRGKGNYEFDYFITAKRAGFESHRPIQENRHFSADKMSTGEFEKRYAKTDDMAIRAMRDLLISNGILKPDGKLNLETASRLGWMVKEGELAGVEVKK